MSKVKNSEVNSVVGEDLSQGIPSFGYGRIVFDYQITSLEGRLLTLVEGIGLKDTQEKAIKDITKQILYSLYNETIYLPSIAVTKAIEVANQQGYGIVSISSNPRN